MDGPSIMTYMKRLCTAIDDGSSIEQFHWQRVVVPLAAPALIGGALFVGGCSEPDPAVGVYGAPPVEAEICGDGADNDNDGLVDCQDDECTRHATCAAVPAYGVPHQPLENCTDKQDNNGNGLIDCQDPQCSTQQICAIPPPTPQPQTTLYGAPMEVCTDGVDNDGDGTVDCLDNDCSTQPNCAPAKGTYGVESSVRRYGASFPSL